MDSIDEIRLGGKFYSMGQLLGCNPPFLGSDTFPLIKIGIEWGGDGSNDNWQLDRDFFVLFCFYHVDNYQMLSFGFKNKISIHILYQSQIVKQIQVNKI